MFSAGGKEAETIEQVILCSRTHGLYAERECGVLSLRRRGWQAVLACVLVVRWEERYGRGDTDCSGLMSLRGAAIRYQSVRAGLDSLSLRSYALFIGA